jgi:L-ascorbate metabolism protein UlaG (beta-lactamase superfamily)
MAKLLYQGYGSYRITAADGCVIYVDPYAGDGYNESADFILVTHQHGDHNQIQLVKQKPGALFDSKKADKWDAPNKLILEPGQEIDL